MLVENISLILPDSNGSIWLGMHLEPFGDWFSSAIFLSQEHQRQQNWKNSGGETMELAGLRGRGFHNEKNRKILKALLKLDEHSLSHPTNSGLVYSVQLGKLVKKMLRKVPENRIPAANALYTAKQLDARLQILELSLPPRNVCIRSGSKHCH